MFATHSSPPPSLLHNAHNDDDKQAESTSSRMKRRREKKKQRQQRPKREGKFLRSRRRRRSESCKIVMEKHNIAQKTQLERNGWSRLDSFVLWIYCICFVHIFHDGLSSFFSVCCLFTHWSRHCLSLTTLLRWWDLSCAAMSSQIPTQIKAARLCVLTFSLQLAFLRKFLNLFARTLL